MLLDFALVDVVDIVRTLSVLGRDYNLKRVAPKGHVHKQQL